MSAPILADTGGLLRALANGPDGKPAWPDFAEALVTARCVIVPSLVLAEVDYFLRGERAAMRRLLQEIFDPKTTYEYEPAVAMDIARAMAFDAKFAELELGLVDGLVAAVAERRRVYRVLTTDRRDFGALRVGRTYRKALSLVP